VRAHFDYVLILQWLDSDDEPTGELLHDFLFKIGIPAEIAKCHDGNDVARAISLAHLSIGTRGMPAIHIESHGDDPWSRPARDVEFGLDAVPGIEWSELGEWLAPLNKSCDYQLLVVGATCFGLGTLAALNVTRHVAPFALTLGFSTSVTPGSVFRSMKEFYRAIHQKQSVETAVESARVELKVGEEIVARSVVDVAIQVLRGVYDRVRTPEATQRSAQELLQRARDAGLPTPMEVASAIPVILHSTSRSHCERAWNSWFPTEQQSRDPTYVLDWKTV
jgi:hypothetical protein